VAGALALDRVSELIEDAARMGYRAVAFSGGEPLVYPGLVEALQMAKALGLHTSVTTNGTLLDPSRLGALRDFIGLLAISLDGPPALHNKIRGSSSAFDRMMAGVENLQSAGIRFGFIHTLTRSSWEHLAWLAEFAHRNGASLFQIHPLEIFGRAEQAMQAQMPDEDVLARAYLLSFALVAKYRGRMRVQIDLVHRDQVLQSPESIYASDPDDSGMSAADMLGVVVLEPDGSMVPVAYGFSRRFAIATSTRNASLPLGPDMRRPTTWRSDGSAVPLWTRYRNRPCRNSSIGTISSFTKAWRKCADRDRES
jgi:Fe-coproporphyrin III synthase